MFADDEDDVYKLVTELCRHFFETKAAKDERLYPPQNSDLRDLKKLRAMCYGILLNKTKLAVNGRKENCDPVCELIKYSFTLRTTGKLYEANKLDECISTLEEYDDFTPNSTLYSVLTFLNDLKSHESKATFDLNPFEIKKYYENVPAYEKYSMKSLNAMSNRFDSLLAINSDQIGKSNFRLPFINSLALKSNNIDAIEYIKPEKQDYEVITPVSSKLFTVSNSSESTVKPHFSINLWEDESKKDRYSVCREGIVTEPESPWQCTDVDSESENEENQDLVSGLIENELSGEIWDTIDLEAKVSEYRTWETLGVLDPEKEPPYIADLNEAMPHITKLRHIFRHSMGSKKDDLIPPLKEITKQKFLENVKLLLLGVENDCFYQDDLLKFQLAKNIIIPDISRESLESVSFQLIKMGNCYKSLSQLVADARDDAFKSRGLIFNALCHSIDEFLSFYKVSVALINVKDRGLIAVLNNIRPLGFLISDINELCMFEEHQNKELKKGIGILTHIYRQANTVTRPNTSLVITSILKSCCEVYFRFLQQWLFEGICKDAYDEFMIKTRSKYLNVKAHRFWTRAFVVNTKSAPGFLYDLTDSILECGKAMRLLKLCDPKNPVCYLSSECHPTVKVCLSFKMLKEQIVFYETYYEKGKNAIGKLTSFWSVIQKEKDIQKHKTEFVSFIQKERILKIKKEREEDLIKVAKEKNKLLAALKTQAEESALRKVKDKNAEVLADKLYIENLIQQEDKAKKIEKMKKEDTFKYYDELAAESEKCQLRLDWRTKRMKLSDERIVFLSSLKEEFQTEEFHSETLLPESQNLETAKVDNSNEMEVEEELDSVTCDSESTFLSEPSNSKVPIKIQVNDENENVENAPLSVKFDTEEPPAQTEEIISKTGAKRPDVLNLAAFAESNTTNLLDNMSAARKNRLRMLREEFGISPNNNVKSEVAFMEIDSKDENVNFIEDVFTLERIKDTQSNRLKNMSHQMDENWGTLCLDKQMYGSSLVQRNRTKNMAHQIGWECPDSRNEKITLLTDAQKNKDKVMMRSEQWFDAAEVVDNADSKFTETDNNNPPPSVLKETPMSCTTDHFTHSVNSSSVPFQSCENTPNSEMESDVNFNSETSKTRASVVNEIKSSSRHDYGFFASSTETLTHKSESSSLTIEDIRMLNSAFLQDYLRKSVLIPLQAQSQLVNAAIIKYFLEQHNLLSHLHSLRSYFFLLNGEFAKSLTDSLYRQLYQANSPFNLLNSIFLKATLVKAISCSITNNYMNSELLSLSVYNFPATMEISNPEVLDCISLNYKISWPINIIFDDGIMEQYSKVFRFLLMVGRVLWVLKEEFHVLKFEQKTAYDEQFHKIQLYRFSMIQFMNALHTYLTCSVLHASWAEFEKELEHATTLDKFYAAHVSYIKKILSRCMLNQKSEVIQKSLCTTFNIILKFHGRITSSTWVSGKTGRLHANFEKLEQMYNSFCQQRAYLSHVAERFSSSGYQPHLTHFLHALNINNSYKLNTKTNSQF